MYRNIKILLYTVLLSGPLMLHGSDNKYPEIKPLCDTVTITISTKNMKLEQHVIKDNAARLQKAGIDPSSIAIRHIIDAVKSIIKRYPRLIIPHYYAEGFYSKVAAGDELGSSLGVPVYLSALCGRPLESGESPLFFLVGLFKCKGLLRGKMPRSDSDIIFTPTTILERRQLLIDNFKQTSELIDWARQVCKGSVEIDAYIKARDFSCKKKREELKKEKEMKKVGIASAGAGYGTPRGRKANAFYFSESESDCESVVVSKAEFYDLLKPLLRTKLRESRMASRMDPQVFEAVLEKILTTVIRYACDDDE